MPKIAPELDRNGKPRPGWWIVIDPTAAIPKLPVSGTFLDVEVTKMNEIKKREETDKELLRKAVAGMMKKRV